HARLFVERRRRCRLAGKQLDVAADPSARCQRLSFTSELTEDRLCGADQFSRPIELTAHGFEPTNHGQDARFTSAFELRLVEDFLAASDRFHTWHRAVVERRCKSAETARWRPAGSAVMPGCALGGLGPIGEPAEYAAVAVA